MSTSKTLKALKVLLDKYKIEIFGYKSINSPNDPIGWYSGSGDTAVSAEFKLLTCNYDCGGRTGFERIQNRSEFRDKVILDHVEQFLKDNPILEGDGLYIVDTQWHKHPDNVSSQMLISLMLAHEGLQVRPVA